MTADFAASYGTLCGHSTSFYVAAPLSLLSFFICLGIVLAFIFGAQPVQVKPKKQSSQLSDAAKHLNRKKMRKLFT